MSWFRSIWDAIAREEQAAAPAAGGDGAKLKSNTPDREKYQSLFNSLTFKPWAQAEVARITGIIHRNLRAYEEIERSSGVPWRIIAAIHNMECSLNFERHLHNGDKLTARTVRVPAGRPIAGKPPFSFHDSAVDALAMKFTGWTDWSIPAVLYKLEGFNGYGYRKKGVNSPYLWSGSQHYAKGKYVSDGKYDPNAVSKQIGVALILKALGYS